MLNVLRTTGSELPVFLRFGSLQSRTQQGTLISVLTMVALAYPGLTVRTRMELDVWLKLLGMNVNVPEEPGQCDPFCM
jgi:hypothetical protein